MREKKRKEKKKKKKKKKKKREKRLQQVKTRCQKCHVQGNKSEKEGGAWRKRQID